MPPDMFDATAIMKRVLGYKYNSIALPEVPCMNSRRMNLALTALIAVLLLAACGQESRNAAFSTAIAPQSNASINFSESLAELNALRAPEGADPEVFAQLKAALHAALLGQEAAKLVSTPPTGAANAVPDFAMTDTGGGNADLTWHYYNQGDYNQDGVVSVADITPLAVHYGEGWAIGEEDTLQAVVDGSGNGTVDISDVTPIAMNFGVEAASYIIESSNAEGGAYSLVQAVPITDGLDEDTARMRFSVNIAPTPGRWYRVSSADSLAVVGAPSNAVHAAPLPQPPSAAITSDFNAGIAPLTVTLDASGSTDSDGVIVKYQWDLDGDGLFELDTDTTPSVQHEFALSGTYHPAVHVTDNDGLQDTASTDILVSNSTWTHTWGSTGNDKATAVSLGILASVYVVGNSDGFKDGSSECPTICKFTPDGVLGWAKSWIGAPDKSDWGSDIAVDGSGNAYVSGSTMSYGAGADDAFLLKLTSAGVLQWQTMWGGTGTDQGKCVGVDPTGEAVYVAGVWSPSDIFINKYDADGALLWSKDWSDSGDETAYDLAVDDSANVYVVGSGNGYGGGNNDAILLKVDADGNLIWQKTWNASDDDFATGVALDEDGNIYVTGQTQSFGAGYYDGFLLKFDAAGNLVWQKIWGEFGYDMSNSVAVNKANGNIIVAGYSDSFGTSYNYVSFILIYDSTGTLLDAEAWAEDASSDANCVAVDDSGVIYIAGLAPNAVGSWESITGVDDAAEGVMVDLASTLDDTLVDAATPAGTIESQTGVLDAGGGLTDQLIIKENPGFW
jgi:hypothetical protein